MWIRSVLLIAAVFLATGAMAQDAQDEGREFKKELTFAKRYSFHSALLDEDIEYNVALPDGVFDGNKSRRYPVIYVLDGGYHQTLAAYNIAVTYNGLGLQMPQVLVVGIRSNNRRRDYTPSHVDKYTWETGGAKAYRTFLRDEFFPHIEDNYATNGHRVLIGHSHGGLFALTDLVSDAPLFQSYISIDPSLDYDDQLLARHLEARGKLDLTAQVYINQATRAMAPDNDTTREEFRAMIPTFDRFIAALEAKKTDRLLVRFDRRPLDDHLSAFIPGLYEGLAHVFKGYLPGQKEQPGYAMTVFDVYSAVAENPALLSRHYEAFSGRMGVTYPPEERLIQIGGTIAMNKGLMENARRLYQMGVELYPDYSYSWSRLGNYFEKAGDNVRAFEAYEHAVKLASENAFALDRLKALKE
ncbi:MAG: hypothetical protein HWE08_09600 [Alphaproteobacteria bacterium]|nr:hypothetical protein [Alphaproteobacteria bacterium]